MQAKFCASMLGCDLQKLVDSFVLRNIQAGPMVGGDTLTVSQSMQQALDTRDALSRALYASLFDLLVERINVSLGQALFRKKVLTLKVKFIIVQYVVL